MTNTVNDCYHCGEEIPADFSQSVTIDNQDQPMCCIGCASVAQTIVDNGLTGYYRHRTDKGAKGSELVPEELRTLQSYDLTEIEQEFTVENGELKEVILTVENVTCAACAWLIERKLGSIKGIAQSNVNTSSARLSIKWQHDKLKLSDILLALAEIGYKAYPFKADVAEENEVASAKAYLRRVTIAGLATMQIMMFAMATYVDMPGEDGTLTDGFSDYFRYVSLLFALPVVFYSSLPFYKNAFSALLAKRLNMDVPVTVAILLSFFASAYATVTDQGEVYFESICMFAFFLLLGRHLEQSAKRKAAQSSSNLLKLIPSTATLITDGDFTSVPAKTLKLEQRVLVKPGEVIPCDGIIAQGTTHCNEAVLTGEQLPVTKAANDWVFASTINNDQAIEVIVKEERGQQLITKIIDLQEKAANDKPKLATIADRLSQYVVVGILLLAAATYVGWYFIEPSHALWYSLAVLVATCPCALSLATPSAYTAATTKMQQFGLLAKQGKTLDTLTQIDHICFDKTGTLTTGQFTVDSVVLADSCYQEAEILALVSALESHSNHPIAKAFEQFGATNHKLTDVNSHQGGGLNALANDERIYIGSQTYISQYASISEQLREHQSDSHCVVIFVAIDTQCVAKIELSDQIRSESTQIIKDLHEQAIETTMLTGDNSDNANFVAKQLGLTHVKQGQSPQNKLNYLKTVQDNGKVVAMFGDGVNDAPVLSQAHLSFAMGTGADIAKSSADIVILHDDLAAVVKAINLAKQTKRIIKQNFFWALGYNLTAVPFAVAGYLPPYVAAIGMSLSSIIVVVNSLRLLKVK